MPVCFALIARGDNSLTVLAVTVVDSLTLPPGALDNYLHLYPRFVKASVHSTRSSLTLESLIICLDINDHTTEILVVPLGYFIRIIAGEF